MNYNWNEIKNYDDDKFQKWWNENEEGFDWEYGYWALAEYYSDHFDKWFNPAKINWNDKYIMNIEQR